MELERRELSDQWFTEIFTVLRPERALPNRMLKKLCALEICGSDF